MSLLQALFAPKRKRTARPPRPSSLSFDGFELPVLRKSVRALRLTFSKAGQLKATAPWRMGDAEIRAFVESRLGWIERHRARLQALHAEAQAEAAALDGLDAKDRRALVRRRARQLQADALALLPRWEPALGVKVTAIGVRAMRSRWGSCNTQTGKIWLSLNLHRQPPECLEYILVHEMVHLLVRPHNAEFRAHLDRHLPQWRKVYKTLNALDGSDLC